MSIFKGCGEGAHKFQGRYDTKQPEWMDRATEIECSPSRISSLYERIYVHDVCVRCGKTVDRKKGIT